jgi:hypothetical protein
VLTVDRDYRALFPVWRDPERLRVSRVSGHSPASSLLDGPGGALGGERRVESPSSQLLFGRLLIFPEVHEAERQLAAVAAEAFGGGCGLAPMLRGLVLGLERFRQPPKMPPGERRETEPDCEQSRATPLGHVEVDAALQRPGERRVRAQTLPETKGTRGVLHVELDPLVRLLEPDREVAQ